MGDHNETVEVIDAATGEVFALNVRSLVSDIRDRLLSFRRSRVQATTWPNLTEDEQRTEIDATDAIAFDMVAAVAAMVAAGGREVIHAQFKGLALDDKGGVKITLMGQADDGELVRLNQVGKKILKISVVDAERFNEDQRKLEPEPDQPELPGAEPPAAGDLDQMDDEDDLHKSDGGPTESAAPPASVDRYEEAVAIVRRDRKAATSHVQRGLQVGFNIAAELMDRMEAAGIVSEADSRGRRKYIEEETGDDGVEEAATAADVEEKNADSAGGAEMGASQSVDKQEVEQPEQVNPGYDPVEHAFKNGQEAAARGAGPDDNPHDGGTDEHESWTNGRAAGLEEIQMLRERGAKAFADGLDGTSTNPWKQGSRERGWWAEGYDKARLAAQRAKEVEPEAKAELEVRTPTPEPAPVKGPAAPAATETPEQAAWWDGSRARNDGLDQGACPHDALSEPDLVDAWTKGWWGVGLTSGS